MSGLTRMLRLIAILSGVTGLVTPAGAQDRPRSGGELIFAVPSEMPSYDGHREGTFGMVHPLAPHYNTLLRVDPNYRSGTKIVTDLAVVGDLARRPRLHGQASARREVPRR